MKHLLRLTLHGILYLVLLIILIFALIRLQSGPFIHQNLEALPNSQTAIVLGAAVSPSGVLSTVFKDRVDTAIMLYKKGKVTTILVTGDNGSKQYNEVNPTRDYLLSQGVPSADIFLDHAGFDTYSSMYRARDVFLVTSAIVVTQSFHLPRAVFTAQRLGIDAYGISADKREYLLRNSLRELLAGVKAFIDILYMRTPKYLGEEIPITGDGSGSI